MLLSEPSSCACWLPDGMYGQAGWHFRLITEADAKADRFLKHYIGTPIAVEPCPAYMAVLRREHAARQTEAAADGFARPGRLRA